MDHFLQFLTGFSGPVLYLIVFLILLACGFGLPIPEDITLIGAGYISYKGATDPHLMFIVSMLGVMIGDSIIFLLGSRYGRKLTKKKFFAKILSKERLDMVQQKLEKHGNKIIFAARFMPGLRAPVFFTCGTLHVPYRVFFFYDGTAAILSVPAIVYSVYHFGDKIDHVVGVIKSVEHGIIGVILAVIVFLTAKHFWKKRKRRARSSA